MRNEAFDMKLGWFEFIDFNLPDTTILSLRDLLIKCAVSFPFDLNGNGNVFLRLQKHSWPSTFSNKVVGINLQCAMEEF